MFGRKSREIARSREEFAALGQQEQTEKNRADALEGEVARLQEENARLANQDILFSGLSGPLNQFGDSAKS